MDFVISRVCFSIFALLVLSAVSQALHEPLSAADRRDIETIAGQFDGLVRILAEEGREAKHIYRVPSLAAGSTITMTVRTEGVEMRSENALKVVGLTYPLHLWRWNLSALNQSDVEELDSLCQPLVAVSDDLLRIEVMQIPVQGLPTTMIFVYSVDVRAATAS